ncbi:hypothetical protein R3P38DRAFT_3196046 [Favolaschia claudopus]|uniref:KOW domain-containing protein n=1 Tax=Favolaschia claudopus TaxID=2862362 RepID=A0AAW0B9R7_9AGAR
MSDPAGQPITASHESEPGTSISVFEGRIESQSSTLMLKDNEAEQPDDESYLDVEEINRSQYDSQFVLSSSDSAPIEAEPVTGTSDEESDEESASVLNLVCVRKTESNVEDHQDISQINSTRFFSLTWVRVNRGKRAGRIAVKLDHDTVVAHDEEGRVVQLHSNATYDELQLSIDSNTPPYLALLAYATREELFPFMRSYLPPLLTYASTGPGPAVSPGDRVVVVEGRYKGHSGFVLQLLEAVSDSGQIIYAKVIPSDRGLYNPNLTGPSIYPRLSNIRRHALDFSYQFRPRDRVVFDHKIWHVQSVNTQAWTLALSNAVETISDVAIDQVRREWETGDMVRVRWGVYSNRTGSVTRIYPNGTIQILDPCKYNAFTQPLWHSSASFLSRAADVDVDVNDPIMGTAVNSEEPYNLVRRDMRDRGTMYHGIRVSVIGLGPLKGLRGVIVGDYDGNLRNERLERARMRGAVAWRRSVRNHHGILLTIRKDASNETFQNIPIEDVLHDGTSTPLLEARHLPLDVLKNNGTLSTTYRGAFPAEIERPRSATPPANEDDLGLDARQIELLGERDGTWLNIRKLANKRVDVHLCNIASHLKTVTKKALNAEGKFGHLLLTDSSFDSPMLTVYGVGPTQAKIDVPKICIRPRRGTDDAFPLTATVERVVIIGPAIDGNNSRLGEYAETIGECGHGFGRDVAGVRFEKTEGFSFYHTMFLCLAKNVLIQSTHGLYDTTSF